ncbi:MAG: hypothetical protein DRI87_07045 [Bacteroidetes bacterium]|nr:MAG: hypothetical protein DRI87_07045 [Bacteroidota bacterium]
MKDKKIIFIKLLNSSFINIDEKILSKKFSVATFQFKNTKGVFVIIDLFSEFMFLLKHIWNTDVVYIWFADFHAVIPSIIGRAFRKKVIIVIGGVDAAYLKDFNYGVKTKLLGRISLFLSTRLATNLLPVTQFTYDNLLRNVSHRLSKKSRIVYNCYNELFKCVGDTKRENNIVTVCASDSKVTTFIKGVDYYIELAKTLPELTFYVVGVGGEAYSYLKSISGGNVILLPRITQKELRQLFCSSKIVCQFSRHEAFGVALLEGIIAGCYPVGYNYGGTKEILSNNLGGLISKLDIEEGKLAIEKGLKKTRKDIEPIKKSINHRFNIEVRKKELLSFIDSLL